MWPIFFEKNLIIGDPENNTGICTLWSKKEFFANGLKKDKYCAIGNLYTADGINYLLKNILANPVMRYLIVCGRDLFGSGDALINFFEKGIDEKRKIIDSNGYLHSNIPQELIEVVRKNIKVIDLRKKEKELPAILESVSGKSSNFTNPVVFPDEAKREEFLTSKIIGFRAEGELSEVWLKILDLTLKFGEEKESEHGLKQKEILDAMAVIREFSLKPFFGFEEKDVKNYIDSFFSEKKPKDVEYTYGERLFGFALEHVFEKWGGELRFFVNQIERVVENLKKSPYSRRIVASLWNPFLDPNLENPPCLTQINWNVKNNKLYQTCIFRSHDLFGAYLLNALALRKLQEKISEEVNFPAGDLIILSQSGHIYENSWSRVENVLEQNYRNREVGFEEDEAGYFRIWLGEGMEEIVIQHYLKDGRKTKYEFRGNSAPSIYRMLLNENLVSKIDHAAYLGKELARAEECLKNKKEYIQEWA